MINFTGNTYFGSLGYTPQLNAFQLRAVPEPSAAFLFAGTAAAILLVPKLRRRSSLRRRESD